MEEIIAQTVAMKHQVMQEQEHAQGAGSDALEWCLERLWHHDGWRFFTKSAGNYTVWALGQGTRVGGPLFSEISLLQSCPTVLNGNLTFSESIAFAEELH